MSQRRDQRLQGRLGTFSSKALWCSNSDLRAFSTSTSLETPEGDWAWRFTTVILRDRSWRDTRHSRCSRSSWQGAGRREECCGSVCRATGVPMGLLGGTGRPICAIVQMLKHLRAGQPQAGCPGLSPQTPTTRERWRCPNVTPAHRVGMCLPGQGVHSPTHTPRTPLPSCYSALLSALISLPPALGAAPDTCSALGLRWQIPENPQGPSARGTRPKQRPACTRQWWDPLSPPEEITAIFQSPSQRPCLLGLPRLPGGRLSLLPQCWEQWLCPSFSHRYCEHLPHTRPCAGRWGQ